MRLTARARRRSAALAALALTGCAPGYDHLQLEATGTGAPLSTSPFSLQEGIVLQVSAVAMSTKGPLDANFSFDLASSDTSVLGVEPALGQPAGPPVFVFFGAGVGSAEILVTVDGQAETPVPATVTQQ